MMMISPNAAAWQREWAQGEEEEEESGDQRKGG